MVYSWYEISRVLITTIMMLFCPDENLEIRAISQ